VNGDPLEAVQLVSQGGDAPESGAAAGEFVTITDDSGAVTVEVPAAWSDVDGSGYTNHDGTWSSVIATPDMAGFSDGWNTPGVWVSASPDAAQNTTTDALLASANEFLLTECTSQGSQPFDDGVHSGVFEIYEGCADTGAAYLFLAAEANDGSYIITVAVQANTEDDLAAIDRIIGSFVAAF